MKLSVSVPADDVEFIDRYAASHGLHTRSGVVQRAVAALRAHELGDAYATAWAEWEESEGDAWDVSLDDGLG